MSDLGDRMNEKGVFDRIDDPEKVARLIEQLRERGLLEPELDTQTGG